MNCYEDHYLTSDRSLDISFLFVDFGGSTGWRAYILTNINYRSRSNLCAVVHRLIEYDSNMQNRLRNYASFLRDGRTIYYICWSKPIHSLESMKKVAQAWSEITAYYIRNGGSFGSIQSILSSRGVISL